MCKITNYFIRINRWLSGLTPLSFICIMGFFLYLSLVFYFPILYFLPHAEDVEGADLTGFSNMKIFFMLLILCPLIETFLFQFLIIKIAHDILGIKYYISIVISALAFGLIHNYGISYQIHAFVIGLLLAYSFVIYENKNTSSYMMVVVLHAIRNLAGFFSAISS